MEPVPPASLEVAEPARLLRVLVELLDGPPGPDGRHELLQRRLGREVREVVPDLAVVAGKRPFCDEPPLGARRRPVVVKGPGLTPLPPVHPERGEPLLLRPLRPLPPRDRLPRLGRECGDDLVDPVERGRVPLRLPARPPPRWQPRRLRCTDLVGAPDAEVLLDGAGIEEAPVVEPAEEVAEVALRGVGGHEPERDAPGHGPVDEVEGDLDLRELRDRRRHVGAAAAGLVVDLELVMDSEAV